MTYTPSTAADAALVAAFEVAARDLVAAGLPVVAIAIEPGESGPATQVVSTGRDVFRLLGALAIVTADVVASTPRATATAPPAPDAP